MDRTHETAPRRAIRTGVDVLAGGIACGAVLVSSMLCTRGFVDGETPVAAYAQIATDYGLPGADITDNIDERSATKIRRDVLQDNQAKPIASVETSSGITVHLAYSGLDESGRDVVVNEAAVDQSMSFVIDRLDDMPQDQISQSDIRVVQDQAERGELDDVSITVVASLDQDQIIDQRTNLFVQRPGEKYDWALSGVALTAAATNKGTRHATIMVTGPENLFDPVLTVDDYRQTDPTDADALTAVLVHELTHIAILNVLGVTMDDDVEHDSIVNPMENLAVVSILGRGSADEKPLAPIVTVTEGSTTEVG